MKNQVTKQVTDDEPESAPINCQYPDLTAYETDYVNRHGIMPNAVAGNDQPENPLFEPLDYEVKITFRSAVPLETVSNFAYPERPIKWLCETGCGCGEVLCEHEQRNRYVAYGRGTKEQLETAIKDYINEHV